MSGPRLVLVWGANASFPRRPNPAPPSLFIENRGESIWEDDGGEYWAFVAVFDADTGERMPGIGGAIGGVGRTYRVLPGERESVPAVFTSDLSGLRPGRYEFEATIPELDLRSERKMVELL